MKEVWRILRSFGLIAGIALGVAMLPAMCLHIGRVDSATILVNAVCNAAKSYRKDFNTWPSTLEDLTNNTKGIIFIEWPQEGAVDPWGRSIVYMPFNEKAGYGLAISWGEDGVPGGAGQSRDRIAIFK